MWEQPLDIVSAARGLDLRCKGLHCLAIRNKNCNQIRDVHKQVMDTKVSILDRDGLLKVEPKSQDKVVGLQKLQSWFNQKPCFNTPTLQYNMALSR